MSQIQESTFNGLPVAIVDHNQEGWFTSYCIGQALEYNEPKDSVLKIFERNREELESYSTTVNLTAVDGKKREIRVFNEEGVMMICFFSKQPKAVEFRQWAVQVLRQYRKVGGFDSIKPRDYLAIVRQIQTLTKLVVSHKNSFLVQTTLPQLRTLHNMIGSQMPDLGLIHQEEQADLFEGGVK